MSDEQFKELIKVLTAIAVQIENLNGAIYANGGKR